MSPQAASKAVKQNQTVRTERQNGMKLRVLGPNQTEVEADGATVLFSYNLPVAAEINGELYVTEKKYSTTTTRHINTWLAGSSTKGASKRPQGFFDNLFEVKNGGAK